MTTETEKWKKQHRRKFIFSLLTLIFLHGQTATQTSIHQKTFKGWPKVCDETFNTKWLLEIRKKEKWNHTHTHKIHFQSESSNFWGQGFYLGIVVCSLVHCLIWEIYSRKIKVFRKSKVDGGEMLGFWIARVLSCTISSLKLFAIRFPPDLSFSVQNCRHSEAEKNPTKGAAILKTTFCSSAQ